MDIHLTSFNWHSSTNMGMWYMYIQYTYTYLKQHIKSHHLKYNYILHHIAWFCPRANPFYPNHLGSRAGSAAIWALSWCVFFARHWAQHVLGGKCRASDIPSGKRWQTWLFSIANCERHSQRVNLHFPMVFLWFFCEFLWCESFPEGSHLRWSGLPPVRCAKKVYCRSVQWNCRGFQYRLAQILQQEREASDSR